MGDLIRMPYSEVTATLELLDRLGVTPYDFESLRKATTWTQETVARVLALDNSVWAALELQEAAVRLGFNHGDLRRLAGNEDMLTKVREVVRGFSEIRPILHAIDCDAPVFVPDGWSYHEENQLPNRVKGIFAWDPAAAKLYLSKKQKVSSYIVGNDLRCELRSQPVFPANVLDYLLKPENQHLIPEDWKGKYICFWGTIYRSAYGYLYVRCLCRGDGAWHWNCRWVGHDFRSGDPALVRAS